MRLTPVLAGAAALAVLSTPVLGWTNEDHELFDLVSALETAEGKGTTFYTFLNTTKSATQQEISRAYRKRSLELHPDKNPDDKKIADRFARLGVISNILRDDEKRKRYDFFHDNGVPKWRGTGYYYSRFRPGLGSVLTGLVIFSCFIHYVFLYLSYRVSKMRITAFRQQALDAAWGAGKKPLSGKRKMKTKTSEHGDPLGMPGINGGKPLAPGSTLELTVEGENVYVVENRKESLISEALAVKPVLRDTWLPRVVLPRLGLAPRSSAGAASPSASSGSAKPQRKASGKKSYAAAEDSAGGATSGEEATSGGEDSANAAASGRGPKPQGRGVEGLGKVGGRRRKTVQRPNKAA
ncbi:hypothetical protein Rhopal_000953-T1 [Rhodotorula paludigena]|uniref:J domain-containing protein n=1 Tax=Rhodotorula paludigena TaxID=86838 RepID=A0AAV5GHC5_9BASI|nr:hypothetical protein Rhopal_000953-T1 [Rhodotorula paludigena]